MQLSGARVLIVVNVEWYFLSHRLALARALREAGAQVTVATGVERDLAGAITAEGFRFLPLPLSRRSMSPLLEWQTALALLRLYRAERPDVVHQITIKPVLYGSLAARLAGVSRVINTVPGLGFVFGGSGWRGAVRRRAALLSYRVALGGRGVKVIFQNPEDLATFTEARAIRAGQGVVILGSGVDLERFTPGPEPEGPPVLLFAARLLWPKGIRETVEAAGRLRASGVELRLVVAGEPDPGNPECVPAAELRAWADAGLIEWLGARTDMPELMRASSVVVLPSRYAEGVPKVLIEAAACGRPAITTDAPGCRAAVIDGETGLLVTPGDVDGLARAMERLIRDPAERHRMGDCARALAERAFSEASVNRETLQVYRDLLARD